MAESLIDVKNLMRHSRKTMKKGPATDAYGADVE